MAQASLNRASRHPFTAALSVPWVSVIALAGYAAVVALVVVHHEPWRDEADPWLMARDASLKEIWHYAGYLGTPVLWQMLLVPLAKSGLPYASMHALHAAMAIAAAALLLFRSPFRPLTRVLIVFSYYLLYEYAAIARNYAPGVLLLWIVATFYPNRRARPLTYGLVVALLANTSVHSLVFAAAIGACFLWDQFVAPRGDIGQPPAATAKRRWVGVAIMLFGGVLAVVQLLPPVGGQFPGLWTVRCPGAPLHVVEQAMVPSFWLPSLRPVAAIVTVFLLALMVVELCFRPRSLFIFLVGLAGLAYIFIYKWIDLVALRHPGLVFILVLFVRWISRYEDRPEAAAASSRRRLCSLPQRIAAMLASILFIGALVASDVAGVRAVSWEMTGVFSHAREVAQFIRAGRYQDHIIAADYQFSAVLPYLVRRQFWYADQQRWGSFNSWDAAYASNEGLPSERFAERVVRQFAPDVKVLAVFRRPLRDPRTYGFRLVRAFDAPVGSSLEWFWVYERALPNGIGR